MSVKHHGWAAPLFTAVFTLALSFPAHAKQVAYFTPGAGSAHLIDWLAQQRARVVTHGGAGMGSVQTSGNQRVITMDEPLTSQTGWGEDGCGAFKLYSDTNQVVVRDLPDRGSRIVAIGANRVAGGCDDGLTTPFGSLDDEGTFNRRVSMTQRPAMNDIVAGLQIAGPSEETWTTAFPYPRQDLVTVTAGGATFAATGHNVPTSSEKGWWVFGLAGAQRAFVRLELDKSTGGETWLTAEWGAGQANRVTSQRFVKSQAGAGFGTVAQASRVWQSGVTTIPDSPYTRMPFYFYLYGDGTGERVSKNLDLNEESRSPIAAWSLPAGNLVQQRDPCDGRCPLERVWKPLRNEGKRIRWVLEEEVRFVDGSPTAWIPQRVVYLLDTGKAKRP